ncbi:MAG: alpha/beta hydrolase [Candidatus Thiodiazotropha weberae]|nr:alpha/beta hydrolase [Candidatus Thiodiazotropha lotti]MCG8013633.1 alpha/beta hydrolase [Candidatus Thiodiazotropha lotti]MCG8019155.1 alpha/beta hydrolase [Candidatus Thiodiazotropha lotti]MCW4206314.1 alpha/beta hydrolase [Candidatus Thiodiazotropha lotti]MCW4213111.1 alpha/beta hydrolase [Candidatus Thiodiazotropha lotti]
MSIGTTMANCLKWICFLLTLIDVASLSADELMKQESYSCSSQQLFVCQEEAGNVALVFIHGWGGRALFWASQLDYFSNDYSVYALDLPGHGDSEKGKAEPSISTMAEGLENFVNQIDADHVVVIGHDIGGYIALSLAVSEIGREKIKAIFAVESMVDTKVSMPKKQYRRVLKSLQRNFKDTARQMTRDLFSVETDQEMINWVADSVATTDAELSLGLLNDFMNMDMSLELAAFEGDLVILNTEYNQPRVDRLKSINSKVVVESVGWSEHFIFLENAVLFNKVFDRLIKVHLDSFSDK